MFVIFTVTLRGTITYNENLKLTQGFPRWFSGEEPTVQCGGHGFDPQPGTKVPHVTGQLSLCAITTEPGPQLLSQRALEPTHGTRQACRGRNGRKKPTHHKDPVQPE